MVLGLASVSSMEGGSLSIEKMLGDDDYDENDFARQVQL